MQTVSQFRIVHVGFPGQQRGRFAIAQHHRQFLVGHFRRDRGGTVRARDTAAFSIVAAGSAKISGMSSASRDAEFHADGTDEDQFAEPFRHHAGQFGADPAAEGTRDQVDRTGRDTIQQAEIDMRDVLRPDRSSPATKTSRSRDATAR